jgi:nitrate reductase assembly molybdenum cofactor insertion protein NarJ
MTMAPTHELETRARDFILASMATGYPDAELAATLRELGDELGAHPGVGPMVARDLPDLQSDYIELFDRGKGRVSLYETEHGRMRGLSKGNDLADIAGFYRAFSLTLDEEDAHEMLDHVAVELEFYGTLLLKQHLLAAAGDADGVEIVGDARRTFLADHLGRFVRAIADQPAVVEHPVYGPALAWCAGLVEAECAVLDVRPAPLDFFADREREPDGETMNCGPVRLPVVR